jgi:CRP-like cAMP-binding protein
MVTDNSNRESKLLASFFKLHGKPLTYKKGRRLLASDVNDKIMYVKSGYLAAHMPQQQIRSKTMAYYTYGPGDIIQIRALIKEPNLDLVYSTLTNASLCTVPCEVMWQEIHKSTTLAAALVRDVVLQNELHARRIENLSYRYASDKLIYRILNLAERFGTGRDNTIYIRIPVTHRQLGMFINMARESVSREMEKLSTRRLVNYERQHITVLDPQGLVDALHESVRTDWHDLLAITHSAESKKNYIKA